MNGSKKRAQKLDALYAKLPALECKGLCQAACGPIVMSRSEWRRIVSRLRFEPRAKEATCPMLCRESGKCTVYEVRPMICRLYGMVTDMTCPHGCVPSRLVTNEEARELLLAANKIK